MKRPVFIPSLSRRALVSRCAPIAAVLLSAPLFVAPLFALPAAGQDGPIRPDQVSGRKRTGSPVTVSGVVTSNTLEEVLIDQSGKEVKMPAQLVDRIDWGDAPLSFHDGLLYFERKDFESAAARFRLAAGDAAARDVVRASARLHAGASLLNWGAADPAHLAEAKEELQGFLDDYADNREVPRARYLLGRAQLLAGEADAAATTLEGLFGELQGETATQGYAPALCLTAGLDAADAKLQAGDVDGAKALYASCDAALTAYRATLDETDEVAAATLAELVPLAARASLGEGFCALAEGQVRQARTFFEGKLSGNGSVPDAQRFGAAFGLAECDFAEEKWRQAQLACARISATDHTSRERVARALVRMAQCAEKLGDTDYRQDYRIWLTTVVERYGDTTVASEARELLDK